MRIQRNRMALIALFLFLSGAGLLVAQNDWELVKQGNGVQVYTRQVEGSSLKEFRAIMYVDATVESAVALFEDTDNFCNWFDSCGEARTVRQIAPNQWVNYFVSEQPIGVSDRDMYIQVTVQKDDGDGSVTASMVGVPTFGPVQSGRVRVQQLRGFWRFAPQDDGRLLVIYQVHSEPGGSIPSWVANLAVTDGPLATLTNMKSQFSRYAGRDPRSI